MNGENSCGSVHAHLSIKAPRRLGELKGIKNIEYRISYNSQKEVTL